MQLPCFAGMGQLRCIKAERKTSSVKWREGNEERLSELPCAQHQNANSHCAWQGSCNAGSASTAEFRTANHRAAAWRPRCTLRHSVYMQLPCFAGMDQLRCIVAERNDSSLTSRQLGTAYGTAVYTATILGLAWQGSCKSETCWYKRPADGTVGWQLATTPRFPLLLHDKYTNTTTLSLLLSPKTILFILDDGPPEPDISSSIFQAAPKSAKNAAAAQRVVGTDSSLRYSW